MQLTDKPLYFLGDHHGDYARVLNVIDRSELEDAYILHVGDGGEGFEPYERQIKSFERWNKHFAQRNIHYKSIRGNHSDPSFFQGEKRIQLSHFELLEDYTVLEYKGKKLLGVGGAVSLDRCERIEGRSYWSQEPVCFREDLCVPVDVLITHSTGIECYPQAFTDNATVNSWCRKDSSLREDLIKERKLLSVIRSLCKPSLHVYGHFHESVVEYIEGCEQRLLAICELKEYLI